MTKSQLEIEFGEIRMKLNNSFSKLNKLIMETSYPAIGQDVVGEDEAIEKRNIILSEIDKLEIEYNNIREVLEGEEDVVVKPVTLSELATFLIEASELEKVMLYKLIHHEIDIEVE